MFGLRQAVLICGLLSLATGTSVDTYFDVDLLSPEVAACLPCWLLGLRIVWYRVCEIVVCGCQVQISRIRVTVTTSVGVRLFWKSKLTPHSSYSVWVLVNSWEVNSSHVKSGLFSSRLRVIMVKLVGSGVEVHVHCSIAGLGLVLLNKRQIWGGAPKLDC